MLVSGYPGTPLIYTACVFFRRCIPRNLLLLNPASKAFRLVVGTAADRALKLGAAKVRYEPFWWEWGCDCVCDPEVVRKMSKLLGGYRWWFPIILVFTPNIGEMIQFDACIFFQMGWFDHQLATSLNRRCYV